MAGAGAEFPRPLLPGNPGCPLFIREVAVSGGRAIKGVILASRPFFWCDRVLTVKRRLLAAC